MLLGRGGGYAVRNSLRFRSSASAYLNRTPATATNRKTWTWSGWVKLGTLSVTRVFFGAGQNSTTGIDFGFQSDNTFFYSINAVGTWTTTAVFRDPSAWYHVVFAFDSTQATQANRSIVYINGVNYAFSSNGVVQNNNYDVNNNIAQYFGYTGVSGTPQYFDGYLAEVNFVDGQALAATYFGTYDANGVWQPIKYSGSFGTNGFYLNFGNTTSTTTLGYDTSGNGNNWTTNNISLTAGATYDSMTDSPTVSSTTVANYAVLNPVAGAEPSTVTYSNANLTATFAPGAGANPGAYGTIGVASGKWYWEATLTQGTAGDYAATGIISYIRPANATNGPYYYNYSSNVGLRYNIGAGNVDAAYGGTYTQGDVIGIALDLNAFTLTFYKNGVSQGVAVSSVVSGQTYFPFCQHNTSAYTTAFTYNFGQQPFTYTPPTGFNALNTYNLPAVTINNGAQYMAATLYTGNGTSLAVSNSANNTIGTTFQPDLVWYKLRSGVSNHGLFDAVRGVNALLQSNLTTAEQTISGVTAFNSTGFTVGSNTDGNTSAGTQVAWQWKANGAGVSNVVGSIPSTVSANTTAGFSIVTYTGNGANATVGHGLGVAPSMYVCKIRNGVNGWIMYHVSTGNTQFMTLNDTIGTQTAATVWNNTTPTSSVFSLGSSGGVNTSGSTYVAYCWSPIAGYSDFGSYTGNGSADGPFIYTGFRPRFVFVKETVTVSNWNLWDSSRNSANVTNLLLRPNTTGAESTAGSSDIQVDFLSNGFKIRGLSGDFNTSGEKIIYAAFAENPFNSSRAR
jgi:hypothetical protein